MGAPALAEDVSGQSKGALRESVIATDGPGILAVAIAPLGANGSVTTTVSDEEIVKKLVGANIDPFNIVIIGDASNVQRGIFSGAQNAVGLDSGVVLSTGDANDVFNDALASTSFERPGDTDLSSLIGKDTGDAAVIEFDFIPETSAIEFKYVFASSEWNQEVAYNDVFGLFINGTNRAFLPSGNVVSVGNILTDSGLPWPVNPPPPSQGYFVNTVAVNDFSFNGVSIILTCVADVTPGEVTHVKLAIADVGDYIYDSALFIEANSIGALPEPEPEPEPEPTPEPIPEPSPSIPDTSDSIIAAQGLLGLIMLGLSLIATSTKMWFANK